MKNKDKVMILGWSGRWKDGSIGWFMPKHASGYDEPPITNINSQGKPCYRVRVTVEVLRDKKGREIVRRFPKLNP